MKITNVALSMAVALVGVNAAALNAPKRMGKTLQTFAKELLAKGETDTIPESIAKDLGYDHKLDVKGRSVEAGEGEDGYMHDSEVIVENGVIILWAEQETASELRQRFFRLTPSGKLEKAFLSVAQKKDGQIVHLSNKNTFLDLKSPETKKMLQYELDFWLKDAHRKKAAPAKK